MYTYKYMIYVDIIYIHICIHTHIYTHIYICRHINMYVCVSEYMYTNK